MLSKIKTKTTIFGILFICLCLFMSGIGSITAAHASTVYDELDRLFISTVNEIFDYEETDQTLVTADKTELYDVDLSLLGVQYSFTYAGTTGFAILIHDGQAVVTEITTDADAPFVSSERLNVYVSHGVYWEYDGSDYYDCDSGLQVSSNSVDELREKAFKGSGVFYYDSERVYYLYKSENKYNVLNSIPTYNYGGLNACAAVAGSNLIAYFDKTYTNLIPNYDPGTTFFGIYTFKVANTTTNAVADTLFNDMGINSIAPGATVSQFRSGLATYVNRQGYTASYTSIHSGNSINFESAKTAVSNGKAIAIFALGFRTSVITPDSGFDIINYEMSDTNHVLAGFGCLELSYTLTNYTTRTDRYIHCSTGVGLYRNSYMNITTTNISEALAINIS